MSGSVLRVLIVDDDYRVAAVHRGFVEQVPGFVVVGEAQTAAEATRLSTELRPDVVLLDIYLPDGDGLEVARGLLGGAKPPIVIVISAATEAETIRLAVQLGIVHYLVKPFGFSALQQRLTAIRTVDERLASWPERPTQQDVSALFDLLRPAEHAQQEPGRSRLAPTLRLVFESVARSAGGASATDVASSIGISRTTAQRYLSQLEQSRLIRLDLRYGSTGRPEHRYTAVAGASGARGAV